MKKMLMIAVCLLAATLAFAGGKKDNTSVSETAESAAVAAEEKKAEKKPAGAVLNVATLNGPTAIPVAYLYENAPALPKTTAQFELLANAQLELPKLITGEVQIGALPANAAAKVFTANNGALVALGVCGTGNLFVITKDTALKTLADLRGKTVACAGQGATPEYVFRHLLQKAGVAVGDGADAVQLDFSIANADIAAALLSNKIQYALVPEPFATVAEMKGQGVVRAIDIQKAFADAENGATYPLTLLVANAKYAASHKDVVNAYIAAYQTAVAWTNENPNKAGVLVQKYTLGLLAPVAAKSIPHASYGWVDASDARADIERLLNIYLASVPEAIGGALPGDDFYYIK